MLPLKPGTVVPMFSLPDRSGAVVQRAKWRGHATLALIFLPDDAAAIAYVTALDTHAQTWDRDELSVVVARRLPPVEPQRLVLLEDRAGTVWSEFVGEAAGAWMITDRYGELYSQGSAATSSDLPTPADLHEWIEWVGMRCSG